MKNRFNVTHAVWAGMCVLAVAWSSALAVPVQTEINVDNFAAVFSGNAAGTSLTLHQSGIIGPQVALPISGAFNTTDDYLYIAAWSDDGVQQGLLIDVTINGNLTQSGDPAWDVFASGVDMDVAGAPTLATMTAQIGIANGGGGPSLGWVAPTIGGNNTGTFPPTNPWVAVGTILPSSQWMWYDSGKDTVSGGLGFAVPFRLGFDHDEFLIFRLPVPEPSSLGVVFVGAALIGLRRGRNTGNNGPGNGDRP